MENPRKNILANESILTYFLLKLTMYDADIRFSISKIK